MVQMLSRLKNPRVNLLGTDLLLLTEVIDVVGFPLECFPAVDMAIPALHHDQRPFKFLMQEALHLIRMYHFTSCCGEDSQSDAILF